VWTASEDEKELERRHNRIKRRRGGNAVDSHCVPSCVGGESEAEGVYCTGGGGGSGGSGQVGWQGMNCTGSKNIEEERVWNNGFAVSPDRFPVPPGDGYGTWSQAELEPK
jgi:hypothetical protein